MQGYFPRLRVHARGARPPAVRLEGTTSHHRSRPGFARAFVAIFVVCLLVSCMKVSVPQSHYIGQAVVKADGRDSEGLKSELIKRYPPGTPITKFTDDLKSLGATCPSKSSAKFVYCKLSIVSEELVLLPVFMTLDDLPSYGVDIDIHGQNGRIEAIEVKSFKLMPSGLLF
jgi:hypothetical protein